MALFNRKFWGIIAVAGTLTLFTGCGGGEKKPQINTNQCVTAEGEEAPTWVCFPEKFSYGKLVAVGIAEKMPPSIQRTQAQADGRNRLASRVATEVKRQIKRYQGVSGGDGGLGSQQQLEDISTQIARAVIRDSRPIAQWRSEKGTLYVLMAVDKGNIQSLIKKRLPDLSRKFRQLENQ
ncbi:MAG: hypothetical protein C6I01_03190 [Epsilonproteobacteria bacterium]|jgi:hypothetical protein|nr:hypothetical protein [Campylobacterota bacterium]NPA88852.1 hypothetical protein [Campylobacterota bacterium]